MTLSFGLDFCGMGAFTQSGGLPTEDLVGAWYASDYVATPRKAIKNSVNSSTALSANLYSFATYVANPALYYYTTVTKTLAYADGPTGATNSAMRIVGTGNCSITDIDNIKLTNGQTYTIAADVKSNTGSSQDFRIGDYNGTMGTKTATTSWQRFSQTFTCGGSTIPVFVRSPDGTTGWDLVVDNLAIFAGASDLGRETLAGHMYFDGRQGDDYTTNPSTGVVDLTTSGSGYLQFATAVDLSAFTLSTVVRRTSAADSGYMNSFADAASFSNFATFMSNDVTTASICYNGDNTKKRGPFFRNGSGWHVITHRYDGTTYDIFVDGSKFQMKALTADAGSVRSFLVGTANMFAGQNSSAQFNAWALYDRALTNTEIRSSLVPALLSRLAADGQSYASGRMVCAEGDSIITNDTTFYNSGTFQAGDYGLNYGVSGSSLASLVSRASIVDATIPPGTSVKHILGVLIGANDLAGYAGADDTAAATSYLTNLMAYIAARRASGWKVVACTVLPQGGATTFNTRRAIVNTGLRTQAGLGNIDALADFDTDAQMGIDASYGTYPANWLDSIHPNDTGHARLMPIFSTAVNTL